VIGPILLKNVFNKEHLKEIKEVSYLKFKENKIIDRSQITLEEIYAGKLEVIVDKKMGRAQLSLQPNIFSKNLLSFLENFGKKYNPNSIFAGMTFARYSLEYGWPQLGPHIDRPSKTAFILDLQLCSNIDWPICYPNISYTLKDGDCIFMESTKIPHWREPKVFDSSDFIEMLFIQFDDYTLEKESEEEDPYVMTPIRNEYHKKREDLGIPDFSSKYNPSAEEKKIKALNNN
jgi:hypothetical protein